MSGNNRRGVGLALALLALIATLVAACGNVESSPSVAPSPATPSLAPSTAPTQVITPPPSVPSTPGLTPPPVQASIPPATPRPSYKAYPLVTVPLQAVRVTDDDGTRPAGITADQVAWWVDRANEIYALAGIRFEYDPSRDFSTVASTAVNSMRNPDEANLGTEIGPANAIAAAYPGKLTVIFRYGGGALPSAEGFSSYAYDFVVMPAYMTWACGHVDPALLAHEIGHYLGLRHPFVKTFATAQEAGRYMRAHGDDPSAFDGDGLADTPPDPFIEADRCGPQEAVTLDGVSMRVPRSNVMSYYDGETDLSPQQIELERTVLGLRMESGMTLPKNVGLRAPIEAETLPFTSGTSSICSPQDTVSEGTGRWSGDRQLTCWLGSTDSLTLELPPIQTGGRFRLTAYLSRGQGYGIVRAFLDGTPVGEPFDGNAPFAMPSGPIPLGTVSLAKGTHRLEFRVVGANPASGSDIVGIDALTLTPG